METLRVLLAWPVLLAIILVISIWLLKLLDKKIQRKHFWESYDFLEMCVHESLLAKGSFNFITERFNEIEQNTMKDQKKVDDLRAQFKSKFKVFFEDMPGKPVYYNQILN